MTSDDGLAVPGSGSRFTTSLIALFVGAAMCWLLAFTASLGERAPLLVVGAPTMAVGGDRLPVRIVAIDEGSKRQVEGVFKLAIVPPGGPPHTTMLGSLPTDVALPSLDGEVALIVEGPMNAETPARLQAPLLLRPTLPPQATFTYRPWQDSVGKGSGPPVYPLDGDVLSTGRSTLLVLLPEGPTLEEVEANPAETRDGRGRPLRLERRGIRIRAPLTVASGATFVVEVDPPEPLELDLLVDGWARRALVVEGRAELEIPADARVDAPFVVHVSRRPFPQGRGVFHVGRVGPSSDGTDAWLLRHLRAAGGGDDPLAAQLERAPLAPELQQAALTALSRRLVPDQHRAPRVGASSDQQRSAVDERRRSAVAMWRTPFRVLAALFALASLVAVARGPARTAGHEEEAAFKDNKRTRLWGALGLALGLSLLMLLDWTLG